MKSVKRKKKNIKKSIKIWGGAPKSKYQQVDTMCYIDFLFSHIQSILTYEQELEGIEEKSIYDFLIRYINESKIILDDRSRLVLVQEEIDGEETSWEGPNSYNTILTNNIIKVIGKLDYNTIIFLICY